MSWFDAVRHRAYVLLRGEKYAEEIEREVRFHLDLDAAAVEHDGLPTDDAELAARRRFGGVTYHREETRRMTTLTWADHLRQDLSYAWRGLKRSPGFTIMVALTLGLGLGVNASMFSLLDELFLRPPSGVAAPREIHRLYQDLLRPNEPTGRLTFEVLRYPQFRAIAAADSTVGLAAYTPPESALVAQGDAQRTIRQSYVTGSYFKVLGVRPQLGRFFVDEETRIETPTPRAVLSDAFWRHAFNADSAILGRSITIDFRPFTIVGVAPPHFTGLDIDAVDVWSPANMDPAPSPAGVPWYESFMSSFVVFGRFATPAREEQFLNVATRAFRSVHMTYYVYDSTAVVHAGPILHALGPEKPGKEISISTRLAGVAIIVLLIACANVTNLLLVRATRRRREIAMRRALGVSRARLYEQLLVESVLLAAMGGAVALASSYWLTTALRRLLLPDVQWAGGAVGWRTVVFAASASLLVGVLAGLAPAWSAGRSDLATELRAGSGDAAYRRSPLRAALLIAQTALSVVLLVGASLFVRSLSNVRSLDIGYDAQHTLVIAASFAPPLFGPPANVLGQAMADVARHLSVLPGVEAIGYSDFAPLAGTAYEELALPDRDSLPKFGDQGPGHLVVSPGYLRAAGVRLIAGRDFTDSDRAGAQRVVIVSQSMARTFWPGESPIGKCIIEGKRTDPCSIVVGLVADVHQMRVIEPPRMQYFVPVAQSTRHVATRIIVRASDQVMPAIERQAALELKRALPTMTLPRITSMSQALAPQFRPWQLGATLFSAFGLLALLVAAIGVYSVVSYGVSQRTHELGVRVALGARMSDVLDLVIGESVKLVAIGIVLGIALSLTLGNLVASLLYRLSPRDPVAMVAAAIVLGAVGIGASLGPALRAARVDPMTALRVD
jgi:putative ABC transport system permease protein